MTGATIQSLQCAQRAAVAKAFEDFVTGTAGQQIIGTFGTDRYGLTLFIADAGKGYASLK